MQPHWSWITIWAMICDMIKGAATGALYHIVIAGVGSAQDFLAQDYPTEPVRIVV
jgi:hypothetical protein